MGRLENKITVITGAGSGVGRACMNLFSNEGACVVGVSRTQEELDDTLNQVKENGGDGSIIATDLSTEDGAQQAVSFALNTYDRIDVLVNCAGVGYSWNEQSPGSMDTIENTSTEKWHEVMAINLDSCFYMCREVIRQMRKQGGGSIVNVASISGLMGLPTAHTYTAAKAAMINLTRSLCVSYAEDNIRANCIAPGVIQTPMVEALLPMFDDPETAKSLTPMARPGTPDEMAYGCLYLASDEASYCNGTVLVIDGGTTARQ